MLPSGSVLFLTLDSCRYDTFLAVQQRGGIPHLSKIGPLHKAVSPSYFTYGSHAAFWMGFTPGVIGTSQPLLNPKAGKLFRMAFTPHINNDDHGFVLRGSNIVEGFNKLGYQTIGSGAVDWFDTSTDTGSVLPSSFAHFFFPGNTWSLKTQLDWINKRILETPDNQPIFLFLNIGETHVPYWYEGAPWERFPSPCVPFGGSACSASKSRHRQEACLEWVDQQLGPLIERFHDGTILACADHGDCWGEDGLWEHGISHPATLTVPLLMRVRGRPISETPSLSRRQRIMRRLNNLKNFT